MENKNNYSDLVSLAEWAKEHDISPDNARQRALRGTLPAFKLGRNWFIERTVPKTDSRIKSGKYINHRKKR